MFLLQYLHLFVIQLSPFYLRNTHNTTPQIGQTHSDNSWATADKLFERV